MPETAKKEARAAAAGSPFIGLAPGLLRAPPRRLQTPPLLSVTAYAATAPLAAAVVPAHLLATRGWETPALLGRAAAVRREMIAHRVGGSWWRPAETVGGEGIAIVSVDAPGGLAACRAMLRAALAENPPERIVMLRPEHAALPALGNEASARGCIVATRSTDPWSAIERARRVYTMGGEIGFLALLAGRELHCFGDSFYSGWGLTRDDAAVLPKPFRRTIDEVFAGACLLATRCLDPYRDQPAPFEEIVAILAEWRRVETANRRIAACVGMSLWKRRRIADFFSSAAGAPVFRRTVGGAVRAAAARPDGVIALWASRMPRGIAEAAARRNIPLLRVEDGFVRSVGLGSDFTPAASLVLDALGMHYDPCGRSDLERLLCETEFDPVLIERARRLIVRLVTRGVTKYNLAASAPPAALPASPCRILVPGQVEDDLSVRLGGAEI